MTDTQEQPREQLERHVRELQETRDGMRRDIARREEIEERQQKFVDPGYVDRDLSLMRRRLAQTEKELGLLADRQIMPEGMGDDGLEPEETAKEQSAGYAMLQDVVDLLVKKRVLPADSNEVPEDEVEAEHARQTASRPPVRRR